MLEFAAKYWKFWALYIATIILLFPTISATPLWEAGVRGAIIAGALLLAWDKEMWGLA